MGILQEQFRELVTQRLRDLNWEEPDLAREMEVAYKYVAQFLDGDVQPSLTVMQQFAHALGINFRLEIDVRTVEAKPVEAGGYFGINDSFDPI